jgi:hypothetical protein
MRRAKRFRMPIKRRPANPTFRKSYDEYARERAEVVSAPKP